MIRINGRDVESRINENPDRSQGINYLADNPNLYDIQRSNNFDFIVMFTPGELRLRAGALATDAGAYLQTADGIEPQELLRIAVDGAFVPHYTQNAIAVKRGNDTIKYAGAMEFASGSLPIRDYIGADAKAVLEAWQNMSGNPRTGNVGHASDYKHDAYIIEYTPDYQQVRKYILKGCWISGLSEDPFAQNNSDSRLITATIEYDKGYPDYSDVQF